MLAPAIFGISNSGINLAIDLLILFLIVIWLSLVYWTYADARRRISDPWIVGSATVASLFPFVGTLVYMIVRPPEYLDDVRERELEIQAAEARLAELGYHLCPHCDFEVEKDFLRCPNCMRKLKDPCPVCSKPLDPNWRICPFCEAEVGSPAPAPRRARRRRDGLIDRPAASGYPETEQSERPQRSERSGRSERPERSERSGRSERTERSGRSERPVAGAAPYGEGTSSPPPRERSGPPTS